MKVHRYISTIMLFRDFQHGDVRRNVHQRQGYSAAEDVYGMLMQIDGICSALTWDGDCRYM